jgi:hypothetical protein
MSGRGWVLSVVTSLLCAAGGGGVVVTESSAGSPNVATIPSMYLSYNPDCTFALSTDGGISINSAAAPGTSIPPGGYELSVTQSVTSAGFNPAECAGTVLQITGPGVSFSTTLGMGYGVQVPETFQPGATYVAANEGSSPAMQLVFTAAASGSSTSLIPPPSSAPSASQGVTQPDLIGSAIAQAASAKSGSTAATVPYRGALEATLTASGTVKLMAHDKRVVSIEAGRYEIVAQDERSSGGLILGKHGAAALTITGGSFTGKRTVMVDLTTGSWRVYSKPADVTSFSVVST